MGVDGIDKADIFDEYFDDDKPKVTNFEKIKAMDIDEMAELLKQIAYKLLKQTADIVNNSLGEKTPDVSIEMFESIKTDFKQWLESESEVRE